MHLKRILILASLGLLLGCSKSFTKPITQKVRLGSDKIDMTLLAQQLNSSENISQYLLCIQFESLEAYQKHYTHPFISYLMDGIREDISMLNGKQGYACLSSHAVFDPTSYRAFVYLGFPEEYAECVQLKSNAIFSETINFCDHD